MNYGQFCPDISRSRYEEISLLEKSFTMCIKQNRATLGVTQKVIINYVMHEGQIQ